MTRQERKHALNVAGEFFVAAELTRRGVMASVTYGNAKKADVVAISRQQSFAIVIEVKTTDKEEWVLGSKIPEASDDLWILVQVPDSQPPRYFVATAAELHDAVMRRHEAYLAKYRAKHNKEYPGNGVETVKMSEAKDFEAKWEKVLSRINGIQSANRMS
jgi:hypothetical protein